MIVKDEYITDTNNPREPTIPMPIEKELVKDESDGS